MTLDSIDEEGASFDFSSNSSDPRVVIMDISASSLSASSINDLGLELDGEVISKADSIDDIINGNGTSPLYYIVRHGDS